MFISTIIVAAGSGSRFGGKKQFYRLHGKPIFVWTLEKFLPVSDEIILVFPKEDISRFKPLIESKFCGYNLRIVAGGSKRYNSVKNALKCVSDKCKFVCIHDAARPLINQKDIVRCINLAKRFSSAICAAQSTDTVKISDIHGFVRYTVDRTKVYLVQTPQVFRKEIIFKAYSRQISKDVTDDAQLVENIGYKVKIVPTDKTNIKITTKSDIDIVKKLIGNDL